MPTALLPRAAAALSWRVALWWRRRWPSKALGLACVSLCAWGTAAALAPARERLAHLAPRMADVGRLDVTLEARLDAPPGDPATEETLARLAAALAPRGGGVPVHLRSPRLALVGTVEGAARREGGGLRLTLGVYRDLAPALLRADAALTLTVAPPSLELLVEDLARSARGREALSALRGAVAEARAALSALRGALAGAVRAQLPADLWARLSADEVVTGALQAHFDEEVLRQIPWSALLDEALAAPEFERLRAAALEGVDARPLVGEALRGAVEHALRSRSVLRDLSLRHPIKSAREAARRAGEKVDDSLNAGAERAISRALEQVQQNLRAREALLRSEGGALLARSAERAQLSRLLRRLVGAVAADEGLLAHLEGRYGAELWAGVERGALELLGGPAGRDLLGGLTARLKGTAGAVARALLFDHDAAAPGPNPLLLSVVEELLHGAVSPVVHLTPGGGAQVGDGFVFREMPASGRGLWGALFEAMGEEGRP